VIFLERAELRLLGNYLVFVLRHNSSVTIVWEWVLDKAIRGRTRELFDEIGQQLGFEVAELEADKNPVHPFFSLPSKYSIARRVDWEIFRLRRE